MKAKRSGLKKCLKMYLVDTNIFLEVLLLGARKDECVNFLNLLRDEKKSCVVTDFLVHSIIVIMGSRCKFAELRVFLLSLLGYKGLHIYHTTIAGEACAAEIAQRQKLDMDDAIQYSSALCVKAEAIISFDKHFNNLGILRKDPCEVE